MYCRMIRGIYLRANGEMACYCGPGEEITLAQVPTAHTDFDFIEDYYRNNKHQYIRDCMKDNILPYPGVCLKCIYLQPGLDDQANLFEHEIEWMHIEATSICNLDCPFCIPIEQRSTYREKPHFLPYVLFEKMVNDIAAHGIKVKWAYFSGRGEAGLHKDVWKMVKLAKEHLETNFMVNTAGNIPFSEQIVESKLDKIKIAIDGVDQSSYEFYRRRGKLDKVLKLTGSIADHKKKLGVSNPKIVWQYILFRQNDSIDSLKRIQEMAIEHGVDQILFKTTFTQNYSDFSLDNIPEIHPDIDLLDIKGMVDIPLEELKSKFCLVNNYYKSENWDKVITSGTEMAKSILRWFILGIERKQKYNAFGGIDDISFLSSIAKEEGGKATEMVNRLEKCSSLLAKAYKNNGREKAAAYYSSFEKKLKELNLGLKTCAQ